MNSGLDSSGDPTSNLGFDGSVYRCCRATATATVTAESALDVTKICEVNVKGLVRVYKVYVQWWSLSRGGDW